MKNNLKKFREKNDMTKVEVSKKANVSPVSYYRYEKGLRTPDVYVAQRIAKALGSEVNELFF